MIPPLSREALNKARELLSPDSGECYGVVISILHKTEDSAPGSLPTAYFLAGHPIICRGLVSDLRDYVDDFIQYLKDKGAESGEETSDWPPNEFPGEWEI